MLKISFKTIILMVVFLPCFLSFSVHAQPVLNYTSIVTGLDWPIQVVNAGDGTSRLFVVEQGGVIKQITGGTVSTFIDLSGVISPAAITANEERGLLSMAFHPDYHVDDMPYFFVYYTTTSGGVTTVRVARYRTMPGNINQGDPSSPDEVISIAKPANQTNHNGGTIKFGPDGMLYIATGDGGGANDPNNLAQNGASLLGKVLRIDINGSTGGTPFYSIPASNPYLVMGDGISDEIWALGLRNPFRWSFDALTGAMWIGDVGQSQREEVNVRQPSPTTGGVNYGWRCYEGTVQPPPGLPICSPLPSDYVAPIYEYTRNSTTGGFCITGGYVYRGSNYSQMYGYYIFADYISGNVWVMSQAGVVTQQTQDRSSVAGFGVDEAGEIYAVSRGGALGAGAVFRIGADIPTPVTLLSFTGRSMDGYSELRWNTATEHMAEKFVIEFSTDGSNYSVAGQVPATNNSLGSSYSFRHAVQGQRKIFYRLQLRDLDGSSRYSSVIVLGSERENEIRIYPTVVRLNKIELTSTTPIERLTVYDPSGKQVYTNMMGGRQGYFAISLPSLARGIYYVTVQGKFSSRTQKIVLH
ncbi:MAG: PQQ-dependent sugar dehydrogenase [Chitinophagaceae bacterium]|nr:PQQ-dependent sugar dehydrogenase [Chitinophagaceae bacterium]